MKHKHYDCIVAWAEGKQIQRCRPSDEDWEDVSKPQWNPDIEYRIKPEPRTAFQIYTKAAYPEFTKGWSTSFQSNVERALAAVINAVKSGELK